MIYDFRNIPNKLNIMAKNLWKAKPEHPVYHHPALNLEWGLILGRKRGVWVWWIPYGEKRCSVGTEAYIAETAIENFSTKLRQRHGWKGLLKIAPSEKTWSGLL